MDDIRVRFSTNVCRFIPDQALLFSTTGRPTTTVTTTTRPPSLLDFDCHFETPCDQWQNARNNLLNWTIVTVPEAAAISTYAPSADHTLPNTDQGSFLTVLNVTTGSINSFYLSPRLNETKCLEFWYYMYGSQVGTLRVSQSQYSGNTITSNRTLWSRNSGETQNWRFAQIGTLVYSPSTFTFRIEFSKGTPLLNVRSHCLTSFIFFWTI